MKIRMLTTRCGPDHDKNWNENQVCNVSVEEAIQRVQIDGVAINIDPFPTEKVIQGESEGAEDAKSPFEGLKSSGEGEGASKPVKTSSWNKGGPK